MILKQKSVKTIKGKTIHLDVSKCTVNPQFKDLSNYLGRTILDWSEILVVDTKRIDSGNKIRKGGNVDSNRVSEIIDDVDINSIRYEEPLIAVYKTDTTVDGKHYSWELHNVGNHRHEGIYVQLGIDSWIFDLYEQPSSVNQELVGWDSNNTKSNVKGLNKDSMIASINRLIKENYFGTSSSEKSLKTKEGRLKFEQALDDFITEHASINEKSRQGIIKHVIHTNAPDQDHREYLPRQAENFVKKVLDVDTRGKEDLKTGEYNWIVQEGYEKDKINKAINTWNETKKKSNFYMHTEQPLSMGRTNNTTLLKRQGMIAQHNKILDNLEQVVLYKQKTGKWPLEIKGFLPQDATYGEDFDKILSVKEALRQSKSNDSDDSEDDSK